jgi:uncharacterized protein YhbP (UPF0306 family)
MEVPQQLVKIITSYLKTSSMMQLATSQDNKPWVCTVYYVIDETLTMYWISLPSRRHSTEIDSNSSTSIALAITQIPGQDVIGVQGEGISTSVSDPIEIAHAISLYADVYKTGDTWKQDFLAGKNEHIVYRFKPDAFVLFDESNYPQDTRKEWRLHS